MARREWVFRAVTGVHKAVLRATGGRVLARLAGMPVVLLTTRGRRTGVARTSVLTAPVHDDDRVVLVASYGGGDRHPDWYCNLRDEPAVTVEVAGRTRPMRARVATGAERAELWPRIVAAYDGYEGYRRRTTREIPVVILEPRP